MALKILIIISFILIILTVEMGAKIFTKDKTQEADPIGFAADALSSNSQPIRAYTTNNIIVTPDPNLKEAAVKDANQS
uniref:Uncharacterized protein n=1 Tax=Panagrolaimus davidi TaxID=227884 RepID=A0A914P4N9_9BILA